LLSSATLQAEKPRRHSGSASKFFSCGHIPIKKNVGSCRCNDKVSHEDYFTVQPFYERIQAVVYRNAWEELVQLNADKEYDNDDDSGDNS
jgi:hypothetical protein